MRNLMGSSLVLVLTMPAACAPDPGTRPPAIMTPALPRPPVTANKKFRVAAIDFGTNGDAKDPLASSLPAILLTELQKGDRFAIHEGGNLRRAIEPSCGTSGADDSGARAACASQGEIIREDNAEKYADAYLSGTITSKKVNAEGAGEVCFDVRLSNAINHEILFAASACTPLESTAGGNSSPSRDGLARMATEIARAVKQISFARVLAANGHLVTVDKGGSSGVMRGMVAYIVATGDTTNDEALHRDVQTYTGVDPSMGAWASAPAIVGEVFIVAVEEAHSVAELYRGTYAVPGDTVFFK